MAGPLFVNGSNGTLGSGSSVVLPAFIVTAGNAILVFIRLNNNALSVTGISDTAGNTYAQIHTDTNGGSRILLWQANNISGHATNVITVSFSGSDSFPEACAIQVTDQNTTEAVTAALYYRTITSGLAPGFLAVEDTLVVLCGEVAATGQTWTPSAGFTTGAEGTDQVLTMAYREVSTLASLSPSLSVTGGAGRQMFTVLLQNQGGGGGGGGDEHSQVF